MNCKDKTEISAARPADIPYPSQMRIIGLRVRTKCRSISTRHGPSSVVRDDHTDYSYVYHSRPSSCYDADLAGRNVSLCVLVPSLRHYRATVASGRQKHVETE